MNSRPSRHLNTNVVEISTTPNANYNRSRIRTYSSNNTNHVGSIENLFVIMKQGSYLYKRSFKTVTKERMKRKQWQWFALKVGYGENDTYGPIVSTWQTRRDLKLLDISTMEQRRTIAFHAGISVTMLDPNYQYSGSAQNEKVHKLLQSYLKQHRYDGTIIDEDRANENCSGASEVVLSTTSALTLTKVS